MKAIAAVALSEVALTVPEIMAAGIFVGIVTFVLGATRLINVANKYDLQLLAFIGMIKLTIQIIVGRSDIIFFL